MFRSVSIFLLATLAAVGAGIGYLRLAMTPSQSNAVAYASADAPSEPNFTALPKAADGHFWADAQVEAGQGASVVHFLVDTGATAVALTPSDAQRLGVDLSGLVYDRRVSTAHGEAKAAEVQLQTVTIGTAHIHDVRALVLKSGLDASLLGMSYLGRLTRLEATPSSLILHP